MVILWLLRLGRSVVNQKVQNKQGLEPIIIVLMQFGYSIIHVLIIMCKHGYFHSKSYNSPYVSIYVEVGLVKP